MLTKKRALEIHFGGFVLYFDSIVITVIFFSLRKKKRYALKSILQLLKEKSVSTSIYLFNVIGY